MHMRRLNLDELAARTGLTVDILRQFADAGLIGAEPDATDADLVELRRVRRLIDDLGLEHEAVTVVLAMRRQLLALQHEVTHLRAALRASHHHKHMTAWIEAEWVDIHDRE